MMGESANGNASETAHARDGSDSAPAARGTPSRRVRACHECDLVVTLPPLRPNERADCPRCGSLLGRRPCRPLQHGAAYAAAALIALLVSAVLPFIGFEMQGDRQEVSLLGAGSALASFGAPAVAVVVWLAVLGLPLAYVGAFFVLHLRLLTRTTTRLDPLLARGIEHLAPWLMADVFLLSVLVTLSKISGIARVELGAAFWAYGAFVVLLLKTRLALDPASVWVRLAGAPPPPSGIRPGLAARELGVTGCTVCGLLNRLDARGRGRCRRCGNHLRARLPHSLQNTLALLLLSVLLYIPANVLPITRTTRFQTEEASTLVGGAVAFFEAGDVPIAVVIITASVLVPVGKMVALAWLCGRVCRPSPQGAVRDTRLYRAIHFIGRWSMVDVFVIALLVALVRSGALMSIRPGPAALAFAGMVIVSMIAVMQFDSRLLWEDGKAHRPVAPKTDLPGEEDHEGAPAPAVPGAGPPAPDARRANPFGRGP